MGELGQQHSLSYSVSTIITIMEGNISQTELPFRAICQSQSKKISTPGKGDQNLSDPI